MSGSLIVEHPVRFDFLSLDKASLVVVRLFAGSQKEARRWAEWKLGTPRGAVISSFIAGLLHDVVRGLVSCRTRL